MDEKGQATDLKGRPFDLPVDTEHKACAIKIWSFKRPHMRAFHLSWFSFFIAFISTFAAAPLMPIIRDNLNLTGADVNNAGIAAVTGTILSRVGMGSVCDVYGPRYGHAFLMLGTAPAVFCMALVDGATSFLLCRLFIGFSLATFVATQFWSTVMFNGKIVGTANATTAGWGNLGGGVTQFLMPLIFTGMKSYGPAFMAWRLCYFVPGALHILVGILVLFFAQDLPDGDYREVIKSGKMAKAKNWDVMKNGVLNYRTWCLAITYGFCFGVELTMNNIIAPYFFDQFEMTLEIAGMAEGASYAVVPYVSRRSLGVVSGIVGAGGNAGSAVLQAIFFGDSFSTQDGISAMGGTVVGLTLLVIPVYFPMWGGMFCKPNPDISEEDYYLADFTEEEKVQGVADSVVKFAKEARSERAAELRPKPSQPV
eukprot:jgi/Pico_ML_1/53221/g3801.t1